MKRTALDVDSRPSSRARWRGLLAALLVAASYLALPAAAPAQEAPAVVAAGLMKRRLYADAAEVLQKSVDRQGAQASGAELRLLGECYYLMGEYGKARPIFSRALPRQSSEKGRMICESRLAMTAYRLGDAAGAEEKIANFLRKYPNDRRAGTLLVIRMKILNAGAGKPAERLAALEPLYRQLAADKGRYGYYNAVLAGQMVGDLYVKTGREERAVSLFTRTVHEMRGLISRFKDEGRPIPRDLMQGADGMSLQIAKHHLDRQNWSEAVKWLENVNYVSGLVRKARLLTAQIVYRRGDPEGVADILSESFLKTVPPGRTKSDMCLLLGFAFRERKKPDLERAKEYLKRVSEDSDGYAQARHGLGDIYREQQDDELAERHYLVSVKSARFAPAAHFYLAEIYKRRAESVPGADEKAKAARQALFQKSADHLQTVLRKYPLTALATQAKPILAALQERGAEVSLASAQEDRVKTWRETVAQQPGSREAAEALISLAQHHARTLYDPRGTAVVKAADWAACAAACGKLLEAGNRPFEGVPAERWRQIRARALFMMGRAELGSLPPGASVRPSPGPQPVPMPEGGDPARAVALFEQALSLADKQDEDFVKELNLAVVEGMFKSDRADVRDKARRRYEEMEADYGADPAYRRLALILADWFAAHGEHAAAAELYRETARQAELDRGEVMHLLYLAGMEFSRAGRKAARSPTAQAGVGILIRPKQLIEEPSILKTHEPFQMLKRIVWPAQGPDLTGEAVLRRVSETFVVPFVWSPAEGGVAGYLRQTTFTSVQLAPFRQRRSLSDYLELILDLDRFRLDFDMGISGGKPTFVPALDDDLETIERLRVIEIYDPARERFPMLARPYGAWAQVHQDGAMLYHIVERVEQVTGVRVFWADIVQKEDALAYEYQRLPGEPAAGGLDCREMLTRALDALGLSFQVVRRDRGAELIAQSNDCFNDLRNFGTEGRYAERAMFNLAINFYYVRDFEKMKLVLREYLKLFDNSTHAHYYHANFWLGWAFERERRYREAVKHYSVAAEETVVLYRREPGQPLPSAEEVQRQLSYDTVFALSQKASGVFDNADLAERFVPFIRFNANVDIKLAPSAAGPTIPISRPSFTLVPCFDLLYDAMRQLGLALRAENAQKQIAEKAYFRMASVYKKENRMHEALETVTTLLDRFPETARKVDIYKLKLDIYKGIKDYGKVLEMLAALREVAADEIEAYKLDYEAGRIHFDMCNYDEAESFYGRALSGAALQDEWLKIREALAHVYLRRRATLAKALGQYRDLLRYETSPVRQTVNAMMIHYLSYVLDADENKTRPPLPEREAAFIERYEAQTDAERSGLGLNDIARVGWIYYALGLMDLADGEVDEALRKLDAASASPDHFMAGDALVRMGRIQMRRGAWREARETFQHLLFAVKTVEPTVRATYYLGKCHEAMGNADGAFRRFAEIIAKYPVSPFAELVRQEPLYIERTAPAQAQPGGGTNAPAPAARSNGTHESRVSVDE